MPYLYRYDPWKSHLQLKNDMLRARYWSLKYKNSWKHESLIAAESNLADGQSIFRISFWKNVESLFSRITPEFWTELHVLQRVRADHPFFQTFTKEDDDFLPDTAWLFWKTDQRQAEQEWSQEGIPRPDIEVLDFDGQWKPFDKSNIMASADTRLGQYGFRPFYFMTNGRVPTVVYGASRMLDGLGDEPAVVFLLTHAYESSLRIYNDEIAIQGVLDSLRQCSINIPVKNIRLFIFDEGRYTYDRNHLAEIPIKEIWRERVSQHIISRWVHFFSTRRQFDQFIEVSNHNVQWYSDDHSVYHKVLEAFQLPRQKHLLKQYCQGIEIARHQTAISSESPITDIDFSDS
ncbi:hypothetical protein [Collimonas antrihumi]|uniref:hypothetical protein n=1 Tax=Collimonas antrihumi TaxID=1940615 RepID=UPI001B8ABE25|nr:hypothetical protein [Collimonas antrihumi]